MSGKTISSIASRAAHVTDLICFVASWALELDVLSRDDEFWFFHQDRVEPLSTNHRTVSLKYPTLEALQEAKFARFSHLVAIPTYHLFLKTKVKSGMNTRDHKCFCHIAAPRTR